MSAATGQMTPPDGISAVGLRKSYGEKVVLDGIDLQVRAGTIFALLGPNGAGKTTTVQILSTLIAADGGEATVVGHSLERSADDIRARIGVTGQFAAVDGLLTAEENMLLMADLHHLDRAEGRRRTAELLRQFELTDVAGKMASTFSGGMRRKLDLAMTLVGNPSLIFLDEPTTGLDPRSRRTMWHLIQQLTAQGVTIFLTTQYLEEADQLADRIAVLDKGKIVAEGTAEELKRRIPGGHIRLRFSDLLSMDAASRRLGLDEGARDEEKLTLQIPSDGSIPALRSVLDLLEGSGVAADALTVHTPDLDDVFLALTGDGSRHHATTIPDSADTVQEARR
ncbi:ATP-binding cassette domain-containing protein [Streptomyces sp. NPDC090046]|uniref:ATP-binding cassette domain-containing protein n=1 Tax=Streptomyces sp. NPDC090046 TaxID=3365928 RepID=UPI00382C8C88